MSRFVRILYLNVTPVFLKRVTEILNGVGFDIQLEQVNTTEAMLEQLSSNEYDLLLLDTLVESDEPALRPDYLPCILLVESEDEDVAISALEQGRISDYVLRTDSGFRRLPFVIRAVLAQKSQMRPNLNIERLYFNMRLEGDYDAVLIVDRQGQVVHQTRTSSSLPANLEAGLNILNVLDLIHTGDLKLVKSHYSSLAEKPGGEESLRLRILHQDKSWHWYDITGTNLLDEPLVQGYVVRFRDVTKRRQDEVQQDAVYRIAQAALVTMSLDDLFSSIHLIISEVMPADNFYIALYDAATGLIDFPYYEDEFDEPPLGPAQLDKGLTTFVIRTGRSLLCDKEKFTEMAAQDKVSLVGTAFAAWLGVPLLIGKQVIGVMGVQHYEDENAYSEKDQKLLEFVSSQIAFAIYRKQVELDLRESEVRFRSLFENATVGIFRSTPDGRLLLANPALLRITGYDSIAEIAQVDLREMGYFSPDDRIQLQQTLARDGEVRGLESVWRKKDGSAIHVRESTRMVHDEQTGETYYEGIVEDITERKKAEQALNEKVRALETLAEIDTEIVLAKDSGSLLEMVCRRATDLLNAPKACIASIGSGGAKLLAVFGFEDVEHLRREFAESGSLGVFNRRKAFMIRNLERRNFENLMPETRKREGVLSVIADSFEFDPGTRSVLAVFDVKPREWSADDQQLLSFLVGQIAISFEKTKLLADAEYRAHNFEMLYTLAGAVASRRDFESVLDMVVESALSLFNTNCGFVYLYDDARDVLELTIIHGVDIEPGITMKLGEGMAGRVAQSRKPMRVDHYHSWQHRNQTYDQNDFSAVMEVPMIYSGQLIGVISVAEIGESQRTFTDEEMRLLSLFAGQAASAVYNARLFSQIQHRNQELDRLYRSLGLLIAGVSSDRYQLCQSICDIVLSEFNQTNCSIWLVDDNGQLLERFGTSGLRICDEYNLTVEGEGLIAKVFREGTPLNVGDVRENQEYLKSWEDARSELAIPLIVEDRVIGVLDLQSSEPQAFNQDDERLMNLFANRAALMIDHVRLVEQTEERNRRLDTLHAIETSFASNMDLRISLTNLTEYVQSRLSVDAVSVFLYDPNVQMLELVSGRGFHSLKPLPHRIRVGEGVAGRTALEHEIIYVPDLTRPEAASQFSGLSATEGFVSVFAVPLVAKGQLRGVLELFYRQRIQNDPELKGFLETLARQVAVAIDGLQLFDQLQQSLLEQQVAQDATIESWSRLLEMRDLEPEGHAQRLTVTTLSLAQSMGVGERKLAGIYRGVLLHDIGKLLLPDSIVYKPGPLTEDEWKLVHLHPQHAYTLLSKIAPFRSSLSIPYCHHENWDGSGYPRGLAGEQIPIEARIFRVLETWDLMRIDLRYRKALPEDEILDYIQSQAGKRFDPHVVEKFLAMIASGR